MKINRTLYKAAILFTPLISGICFADIKIGELKDGGVIACLATIQCKDKNIGGAEDCVAKNLIAQTEDNHAGIPLKWSTHYDGYVPNYPTGRDKYTEGNRNTTAIIQDPLNTTPKAGAALKCQESRVGGYTDWYLPARAELGCLYNNKEKIGGFQKKAYWSSSEYNYLGAWQQDFEYGFQYGGGKLGQYLSRCVRTFTP